MYVYDNIYNVQDIISTNQLSKLYTKGWNSLY